MLKMNINTKSNLFINRNKTTNHVIPVYYILYCHILLYSLTAGTWK